MAVGSFIAELNRRRVFRALVGYGIAAFAVLQIIEPVMHGLHWSEAVLSYVVVALALGFPLVVGLAWIFDVNAGRIERTPPPAAGGLRGARLSMLLVGVGLLAAAPGILYYFVLRSRAPSSAREAASGTPSIAVLPFVNMSSEKENEYFSDGITEELINALANIEGLRVASRTGVFALKGKDLGVRQIGDELKVKTLLEGSVRREGNALRVTSKRSTRPPPISSRRSTRTRTMRSPTSAWRMRTRSASTTRRCPHPRPCPERSGLRCVRWNSIRDWPKPTLRSG